MSRATGILARIKVKSIALIAQLAGGKLNVLSSLVRLSADQNSKIRDMNWT